MIITAIFKNQGVPATGLTPTIDIYNVTGSLQVVTAAAMIEVGGGIYKYDFATFDSTLDYAVICDGGSSLGNADRYATGGTTVEGKTDQILTDTAEMQIDLADGGRLDLLVDGIKAKTDLIPADPADQSQVEAAIAAAEANIRGIDADSLKTISDQLDIVDTVADGIKARTDNLPDDPADESLIEAAIIASEGNIRGITGDTLDTLSGQLDIVDAVVDVIKLKTDLLPADPASQSAVLSGISATESNIRGADLDTLKVLSDQVDAVQAQTDLLPTDPADQSLVEAAITAAETNIRGIDGDTLKTLSDQVDTADAVADAIKAKTDNLPADPASGSSVAAAITASQAAIVGVDGDSLELLSDQLDSNLSAIQAIQNNTTRRIDVPARLVRPDSGGKTYRIILGLYDTNGNPEEPDSAPTIQIENVSGIERLISTSMTLFTGKPGQYYFDLAVSASDPLEVLIVTVAVTENGITTYHRRTTEVTEFEADLNEVQANVSAIKAKTDYMPANTATELTNIQGAVAGVQTTLDDSVTGLAAIKTTANTIQAKTDNLPVDTAAELNAIDADNVTIIGLLQNATYGLNALKTLLDAIDTSTELAARFSEIKGIGWTTETLTGLDVLLDAIKAKTDFLPASTIAELDAIDTSIADLDADIVQHDADIKTDLAQHDTDIKALLQNATYGLAALRTLLDTINADTTTGVQAMFDEVKGVGWTTETLVQLDSLIDAIKAKTDFMPANTTQELIDIDTEIAGVRERTNRLPDDPASQSVNQASLDAAEGRMDMDLDALLTANSGQTSQLGTIKTTVDAIKFRTDFIPDTFSIKIANIEQLVTAINAATSETGMAADIQVMLNSLQTALVDLINVMQTDVTFIRDIEGGRWRIVGTQMVFYKEDNVTEVARFNLFDTNGSESASNVFERQRV